MRLLASSYINRFYQTFLSFPLLVILPLCPQILPSWKDGSLRIPLNGERERDLMHKCKVWKKREEGWSCKWKKFRNFWRWKIKQYQLNWLVIIKMIIKMHKVICQLKIRYVHCYASLLWEHSHIELLFHTDKWQNTSLKQGLCRRKDLCLCISILHN